ncbi:hypothetical protein, partial [uncultured Gammaproteobacteria bacterium]
SVLMIFKMSRSFKRQALNFLRRRLIIYAKTLIKA